MKIILTVILSVTFATFPIEAEYSMGIICREDWPGEREAAQYMRIAAENLGWQVELDERLGAGIKSRDDLDFTINLIPNEGKYFLKGKKYQTIYDPIRFVKDNGAICNSYMDCDGFLLSFDYHPKFEVEGKVKHSNSSKMKWYPTVPNFPYTKLTPHKIMVMIAMWGNRRDTKFFQELYKGIDDNDLGLFYGSKRNQPLAPRNYQGTIPFDGYSMINVMQECGIVLILHSDVHNSHGIPTARIFQAAASSSVIISDKNPFVEKHFGDSVLYIDTEQDGKSLYDQVRNHFDWIQNNPEEAAEKAFRAHQIFEDHFLMEDQLLRLKDMHEGILQKSKCGGFVGTLCDF